MMSLMSMLLLAKMLVSELLMMTISMTLSQLKKCLMLMLMMMLMMRLMMIFWMISFSLMIVKVDIGDDGDFRLDDVHQALVVITPVTDVVVHYDEVDDDCAPESDVKILL